MKKILLFLVFVMGAFVSQAQTTSAIEKMQNKEMDALQKIVNYNNENISFTKNQTVRLERIMFNKSKAVLELRAKEVAKRDYMDEYLKISEKYDGEVEKVLTAAQRIEFRKNKNKQITKKKD